MDVKGVEVIYFAHENYERTTYMVHFGVVDKKTDFFACGLIKVSHLEWWMTRKL